MTNGENAMQDRNPNPPPRPRLARLDAALTAGAVTAADVIVRPAYPDGVVVYDGRTGDTILTLAADAVDAFAAQLVRAAGGVEADEIATRLELAAPDVIELTDRPSDPWASHSVPIAGYVVDEGGQ
jgi:hypothetical protein